MPATDVTILIATCDRPRFLERSVGSVLRSAEAAPHLRTRVLVVDDAASGSAEPVARAAGVDYARNPERDERRNPSAARRWGLAQVDSPLVGLFDDDDEMLDDHISRLAARIEAGADVCATGYRLAWADPADPLALRPAGRVVPRPARLGDLLRGFQPVNDQCLMRTDVARSAVWDPDRENVMMYHVWLQLLLAGRRFAVNPTPTYLYRQHETSLSHTLDVRDAELRAELLEEYRSLARATLGRVPGPSLGVRLRLLKAAVAGLVRPPKD